MPFAAVSPFIPSIIGVLGGIFGGGGGGSKTSPQLDQRAGLENDALRQLLAQLGTLRGDAGTQRTDEQNALDALGVLFDFSGLPGNSPETSSFLSELASRFEGVKSVRPGANEFSRLQSLLGPLASAAGGNAANVQAGISNQRQNAIANALGGAAGGATQSLLLRNLLASLTQQGSGNTIFGAPGAVNPTSAIGQLPGLFG